MHTAWINNIPISDQVWLYRTLFGPQMFLTQPTCTTEVSINYYVIVVCIQLPIKSLPLHMNIHQIYPKICQLKFQEHGILHYLSKHWRCKGYSHGTPGQPLLRIQNLIKLRSRVYLKGYLHWKYRLRIILNHFLVQYIYFMDYVVYMHTLKKKTTNVHIMTVKMHVHKCKIGLGEQINDISVTTHDLMSWWTSGGLAWCK